MRCTQVSHIRITPHTKICQALHTPLKSRPAVLAMAYRHRENPATSTLSATYQENNMQKNTTSLWAGSTVAGLFV
jgi:hypothetical protein